MDLPPPSKALFRANLVLGFFFIPLVLVLPFLAAEGAGHVISSPCCFCYRSPLVALLRMLDLLDKSPSRPHLKP